MPVYPKGMAVHGAAWHTDVTRRLFLLANEGHIAAGTSNQELGHSSIAGGANANEPMVMLEMRVPDDFVSFIKVEALWSSAAAAGNMNWRITADYNAEGEALNNHTDAPVFGTSATGGAGLLNVQEPANVITLANLAIGDYIGFTFNRGAVVGDDTLDAIVNFYGLLFTYVANQ